MYGAGWYPDGGPTDGAPGTANGAIAGMWTAGGGDGGGATGPSEVTTP
jgi:hypothetical protein